MATIIGEKDLVGSLIDRRTDINHSASCCLKSRCTPGKERRGTRWEHEAVLEAAQKRLDHDPEKLRLRKQTIEHPFGTIKAWMGSSHFQMKMLKHVGTEMSLHVLAYNLKRVMKILGIKPLPPSASKCHAPPHVWASFPKGLTVPRQPLSHRPISGDPNTKISVGPSIS